MVVFQCRLEGSCCKKYWVPVTHLDLWRLYYYGGIGDLENYVRLVESSDPSSDPKPVLFNGEYKHLALAERGDSCVFLENGKCRVHSYKPLACRFYPFVYYVNEDGDVEIDVNEKAIEECPGLVVDNKPVDPALAEYLKKTARVRILELKLWSRVAEEWSRLHGNSSSLSKLVDHVLTRAREDYKELLSRGLWIK
jgi:Fe-S-cluster containining protein